MALLSVSGCQGNKRASLEKTYAEARLQFQQGFADQPLELAETGYKESTHYPDLNWKFRVLTAEARARKGRFTEALELLEPDPPSDAPAEVFGRRRLAQATSLCQLGNYEQAETRLAQAGALAEEHSDQKAAVNYARGRCEMSRREWRQAENYLRPVAESDTTSDPYLKAWALASLGGSMAKESRYEEAIDWYSQCLTVVRSLRAPPLEQLALGNLGFLYAELRDFPNARRNSEEAERIASQWKILRDQQKWLLDIGFIQSAQGMTGAAEESYKHALAIATQLGDTDVIARCLHNLTGLKLKLGQTELAEKYHQDGANLGLKSDNLMRWRLDQAAIVAAHADYTKALLQLQTLLKDLEREDRQSGRPRYLFKWVIQSRLARDYAAAGNAGEAEKWFQQSIATVDEATKKMKHEEFRTAIRDNMPVYDAYVAFLIARKQTDRALQVAQLGRARTLLQAAAPDRSPENAKAWRAKIQGYLRRNKSALFSYFATEKECYLWAITPTKFQFYPLGMSGPDLDNLIDSYQQEIQQHLPLDASLAAKKLFQVLVQPAIDLAPPGSHVVVVADSKIYSLNFETLVASKGAEHYWIEDVDIQNTSSIDLLVTEGQRRAPAKGLLLIGAPAQADPHFAELPHAQQEMESVQKHFLPTEIKRFSGRDATPDSYMNSSPGSFRVIHLATHGTPNAVEPLQSAIILSAGAGGKFKLLGQDIVNKHLNADLVTISACEGVGTNVQSLEGLLGLEWAFMRAGAHQVVAALWDVDDTITPGLMDDFYGQMEKGQSAADALRHAKLALLHAGGFQAAPYYWGTLQLYTRF